MFKKTLKNRKGLTIVARVSIKESAQDIAFIQHGFSGFKEQDHIMALEQTFLNNNINVVNFDSTHAFGESDGDLEHATLSNHIQDLEDVIDWAKNQDWYQEPFYLAGHSLGGGSILHYTQQNLEKVKALAPLSAVVSGKSLKQKYTKEQLNSIEKQGYFIKKSSTRPDKIGKVTKNFLNDLDHHDFLNKAHIITQPCLIIVGKKDITTPPTEQKKLLNALTSTQVDYHELDNSEHTFRSQTELDALKTITSHWLKSI